MARKKRKKSGIQDKDATPLLPARADTGTEEFRQKHALESVKTDLGGYVARVKDKRPIDKYHRLYCIDAERGIGEHYRRGINEEQWRAADRFSCNYERTYQKMCKPLDGMRVQTSVNAGMYPLESVMQAIHQHTRTLKELSRGSQDIAQAICCEEICLLDYEGRKGWRKGYGMIRLTEALEELIEAFKPSGKTNRARS